MRLIGALGWLGIWRAVSPLVGGLQPGVLDFNSWLVWVGLVWTGFDFNSWFLQRVNGKPPLTTQPPI